MGEGYLGGFSSLITHHSSLITHHSSLITVFPLQPIAFCSSLFPRLPSSPLPLFPLRGYDVSAMSLACRWTLTEVNFDVELLLKLQKKLLKGESTCLRLM